MKRLIWAVFLVSVVSIGLSEPRPLGSAVDVETLPNGRGSDNLSVQRGAVFFMNYCSGCHSLRYLRPNPVMVSLPEPDARQWFGRMPPDLSLTARERGPVWLFSYLTGFYPDHSRPFGANNTLVPDVAMPNVLYPLKGQINLEGDLHDVISFLVYVAEPERLVRYRIGLVVMAFLAVLGLLIYQLKRLYWRDIQ